MATYSPEDALINVGTTLGEARFHKYMGGSNDLRGDEAGAALALSIAFGLDLAETREALDHFADAAFEANLEQQRAKA